MRQQRAKIDLEAQVATPPGVSTFCLLILGPIDIGVIDLTFAPHINLLCPNCYCQLCQLRVVSRSLTSTAASTLIHSFVFFCLDYCSALSLGLE